MELKDAIRNRRTARQFKSQPISDDILLDILEAGTWAPSHGNNQPWQFLLIGNETRKRLAEAYQTAMEAGPLKNPSLPEERKQGLRNFTKNFGNAAVLLAVTCLPATTELDKYDFPLATAAAIQNILLTAWEKEIAGIWLSFGNSPAAQTILNIPENGKIIGLVALGYPETVPPAQPRTLVKDKLHRLP